MLPKTIAKLSQLGFKNYEEYLAHPHWQGFKDLYYKRYGRVCKRCGAESNLYLHHLTYKYIGNERFSEVRSLCKTCHDMAHGRIPNIKKVGKKSKKNGKVRFRKEKTYLESIVKKSGLPLSLHASLASINDKKKISYDDAVAIYQKRIGRSNTQYDIRCLRDLTKYAKEATKWLKTM